MAVDEKVINDIEEAVKKITNVKELLNRIYYHPEFGNIFNKPVLSLLITACDYLNSNLDVIRVKGIIKGDKDGSA